MRESRWLSMVASGRWWLPSLPSELTVDLPLARRGVKLARTLTLVLLRHSIRWRWPLSPEAKSPGLQALFQRSAAGALRAGLHHSRWSLSLASPGSSSPPTCSNQASLCQTGPDQSSLAVSTHFQMMSWVPFVVAYPGSLRHNPFEASTYSPFARCVHCWLAPPLQVYSSILVSWPPPVVSSRHLPKTCSCPFAVRIYRCAAVPLHE